MPETSKGRKVLFRVLWTMVVLVFLLVVLTVVWWFLPARTPSIVTKGQNSVSELDYLPIGGMKQCILIRSKDTRNPILLFLHGGPGMPMMYLAHEFQRPLENKFTVVQWDRRGAGKTYSKNKPDPGNMNVRQLVDDAFDLLDTLRRRYNQQKIILAGHSFGTYLGSIMVKERPELFRAYISIGQVVDHDKARAIQENFVRQQAKLRDMPEIFAALDADSNLNLENSLFEFGGELKDATSFFPLIWSGLQAPEYTLPEVLDVAKGSSFSSANMKYNVLDSSIYYSIRKYTVPVYFFEGRSDYTTPFLLVEEYFNVIEAPHKEIVWFGQSAHFPFFEEPGKFCRKVIEVFDSIDSIKMKIAY